MMAKPALNPAQHLAHSNWFLVCGMDEKAFVRLIKETPKPATPAEIATIMVAVKDCSHFSIGDFFVCSRGPHRLS